MFYFKKVFFYLFIVSISAGFTTVSSQNISLDDIEIKEAPEAESFCQFQPTDRNSFHKLSHQQFLGKQVNEPASEFNVTYINNCGTEQWPEAAMEAVQLALDIWEFHLQSTVPIKVRAIWQGDFPGTVIGSAGPTRIARVPSPVGEENTWYTIAQANSMLGFDILETVAEEDHHINMQINCNFDDWYFGTDANPPEDTVDFVTVILHEIGHGVGFLGTMQGDEDTEVAGWGISANNTNDPIIYDRFVEDGAGNSIVDESVYSNNSNQLYNAVTGGAGGIFFNGLQANSRYTGDPVPLYAPTPWEQGSSFSHLETEIFTDTDDALMRPVVDRANAIHTPGAIMCAMLEDQGWPLGNSCLDLMNVESSIVFTESALDFGISNAFRTIELPVSIMNDFTAEDPLRGRIVVDSDHFTTATAAQNFSLNPGESAEFNIRYIPIGIGSHDASALLFHNSTERENPIVIELAGEAIEPGRQVALEQNYPNPFNTSTTIPYAITHDSRVQIEIYNTAGQRVAKPVDQFQTRGRYEVSFDAGNLATGVYYYRILVEDVQEFKQLILIK